MTAEERNKHYEFINNHIDEYVTKHKVNPSNARKYFKNKTNRSKFLEKYKLSEIVGIKRILDDVLDDWHFIQKDSVMKFEGFISESMGNISIDKAGMEYERVLADLYDTSVGHVNITNEDEHKYNVVDFGKKVDVIIYSKKDLIDFKRSIIPTIIKDSKEFDIDIHKIDVGLKSGKEIKTALSFSLDKVVSDDKLTQLISSSLNESKVLSIVLDFINDYDILRSGKIYDFKERYRGYYIWHLVDKK